MGTLQPRLHLKVAQKQILTPGLVQMVSVLALNKLELKEMINQEIMENPILEEFLDDGAVAAEELGEAEEWDGTPADQEVLEVLKTNGTEAAEVPDDLDLDAASPLDRSEDRIDGVALPKEMTGLDKQAGEATLPTVTAAESPEDPFQDVDFGSFFDDYLDPGYRTSESESVELPSFENFLSSPTTLVDHLRWQLTMDQSNPGLEEAIDSILGNLDENGYLTASLEEIAASGGGQLADLEKALPLVQECDPSGIAARDLRECLLIQLRGLNKEGTTAWKIVSDHLKLLQNRQYREIAKAIGEAVEKVEAALEIIRRLDPFPGQRYSNAQARLIEPDVFIVKSGDEYVATVNEDDLPQLRLNPSYRRLLDRGNSTKEVRDYVKERYTSAMHLLKNIEQRKQTILRVCNAVIGRQRDFLDYGVDYLKPMMIKEVAEEIGVHPSTVSRAVASKYAHTPQGVYELRYFFSEAVSGPSGADLPLLILKRKVKKMIEQEDKNDPLTDDQITQILQSQGIMVNRRTVAKYRADMKIPSTHQRRNRH
jgi:RNA polymerase sigma-54 factor